MKTGTHTHTHTCAHSPYTGTYSGPGWLVQEPTVEGVPDRCRDSHSGIGLRSPALPLTRNLTCPCRQMPPGPPSPRTACFTPSRRRSYRV